VKILRKAKHY